MNVAMNEPRGGWKEIEQSAEHMLGIKSPSKLMVLSRGGGGCSAEQIVHFGFFAGRNVTIS